MIYDEFTSFPYHRDEKDNYCSVSTHLVCCSLGGSKGLCAPVCSKRNIWICAITISNRRTPLRSLALFDEHVLF